MSPGLVSVIIPTYNRAVQVGRAIDSVLAQEHPLMEVIVVDDGSTDGTPAVLAAYRGSIQVLRQSNAGASAARNLGLRAARGEIVAFLDSDDVWLPGKLGCQVALLERAGPQVPCCLSNMRLAYADGRRGTSFELSLLDCSQDVGLWTNVMQVLATRFFLFNQCVAIRRSALEAVGGFDEHYAYMEDYDLAMRLALVGPWVYTREPLAVWHEGSADSLTGRASREQVALQRTILDIHCKVGQLAPAWAIGSARRRQLDFERRRQRFKLEATRLAVEGGAAQRACGRALVRLERLGDLLYTRSPLYPQMRVEPISGTRSPPIGGR